MSTAFDGPSPHFFHQDPGVIVITRDVTQPRRGQVTRPPEGGGFDVKVENEVVGTVPAQRTELPCRGQFKSHHVSASLGRTRDGVLYASFEGDSGACFTSADQGRSWTSFLIRPPGSNWLFYILPDDTFMNVSGSGGPALVFWRSGDRGQHWEQVGQIRSGPFEVVHHDGNLVALRDGSVLLPVQFATPWNDLASTWSSMMWQQFAQYMMRSLDGGRTWRNAPDPAFWRPLLENHLTTVTVSPRGRNPGPGGTYPGCWETGIVALADGQVLAALRYSGRQDPWHRSMAERWNALASEPDRSGRIYRHVMLARSADGGDTWQDFGPVVDAAGEPLLIFGECNGELVQLPDGRVVLVHQRRYPYGQGQLIARVSEDGGRTWLADEYRLHLGFGYSSSIAMADGTIITATGSTRCDTSNGEPSEPPGAAVIRWKLLPPALAER